MAQRRAVEQLPAFATISHDDRRGALWIAAILSLIFVTMTFGTRMYVRKHMLGFDDFASMVAVALAVVQYASLFAGMPSGLGTSKLSVTAGNEHKNGSLFLTSQAVFICGLYMAKFSVLLATERLLASTMKTVQRICVFIRVSLLAVAVACILLITVRCSARGLVAAPSSAARCSSMGMRWLVIAILDAATEVAILGVFYSLVWSLQMRAARKWMLTILLALRMLCPVFTGVYAASIQSYSGSADPGVQVMSPLVWQQVALGYSLIAALLIALIPFIRSFHTGMVMNVQNMSGSGEHAGSSARSRDNVYRLRNLSKYSTRGGGSSSNNSQPVRSRPLSETAVTQSVSRPGETQEQWRSMRPSDDDAGSDRSPDGAAVPAVPAAAAAAAADGQHYPQQQEPIIIQKTVDWSVQYEEGETRGLQHPGLPQYLSPETVPQGRTVK
ncbi:hypothetical protein V2A60_009690 [Cordyceps javanica]|uniref:Rhodopsin domain-containing protein n=1 Tax=Cordyceps javanica TaxID=43265 RepID=A0A545VUZ6_9HYPO|nr:hypothetical protein IF1G_06253 [Cordyceps javanica]TQW05535.1 hypothetical protein IF2G_06657 [Cordyceps javanica]